jgi:hypothetical protein
MKAKVTLTIDVDQLRKARLAAARKGLTVSALIEKQLEQIAPKHQRYARARKSAITRLKTGFDLNWNAAVSRTDLHKRTAD